MAFSYHIDTDRGKVRFLIPDFTSTAYDLQDEEIDYLLSRAGSNVTEAAAQGCEQISRRYAVKGMNDKADTFAARAKELRANVSGSMASITMDKEDGYSQSTSDGEYEPRTWRWTYRKTA